jgi:predicted metal-dependent hydrolase
MPHIPIPPQMTLPQRLQTLATNTHGVGVANITQPNSNVAQQIKDVAEQQARMVLDEWMKQYKDLFEPKESKLKIQNLKKEQANAYIYKLSLMVSKE